MNIRPYTALDEEAVINLWHACGLVNHNNDPKKDILMKLEVNAEWFLVGDIDGAIVGSCMVGYEGHRGWINYLAVCPEFQGRGYASEMMSFSEDLLRGAGCPKVNLQVRSSNAEVIKFYQKLGFSDDQVTSLGKRLL